MALFGKETPQEQQRVEAWRAWFIRQHPLALAAAVLSIFSLTHFGTLFADEIAGIVLGVLAIRKPAGKSTRLAWVGLIVGVISLVCAIALYTYRPR